MSSRIESRPLRLGAVLGLCRFSNLPTVWMNVLAATLASGAYIGQDMLLLAVSMSCFYCGGMAMNDLFDLAHDRVHQPYRPIAAGRLEVRQASAITVALFVVGFGVLSLTPHPLVAAGAATALFASILIYNRWHKRHASTVLAMGAARGLVYFVTAAALTGTFAMGVVALAAAQMLYTLLVTGVARVELRLPTGRYGWPVIPWMIAAMPLVDGIVLALLLRAPIWLLVGAACSVLTRIGQRYVRGD